MTFGASLAESFSSFAATSHFQMSFRDLKNIE
jgi:hypothetical protein